MQDLEGSQKVEVSCDVTPDLAAYQTAVETRTNTVAPKIHIIPKLTSHRTSVPGPLQPL